MRGRDEAPGPLVDLVAGPDDRRRHPGLRDRAPARRAQPSSPRRSATPTAATRREFRRGFTIQPGERVLLVDDILTTGGSLLAMIPAVEAMGGEIVECAVLVDRSGGRATLTSPTTGRAYPLRSLWQLDLPTYEPGDATCPRCAAGEPVYAPGSTGTGTGPRPAPDPGGSPHAEPVRRRPGRGHRDHRRGGAAARATPRCLDPDGSSDVGRRSMGVIVGVDSAGLADVRGFTLRWPAARRSSSGSASSRTATEFPPGHLAEHQATAEPVRVWFRMEAMSAARSGSRTPAG